jgi:hypothetical protein
MPNKATKQKQLKPTHQDAIVGAGEFTIPTSYRWACSANVVHITTKDRYRGVVTTEIPIATMREIIHQVDNPKPEVYDAIGAKAAAAEAVRLKKESMKNKTRQKKTTTKKSVAKQESTEDKHKPSIYDLLPPEKRPKEYR